MKKKIPSHGSNVCECEKHKTICYSHVSNRKTYFESRLIFMDLFLFIWEPAHILKKNSFKMRAHWDWYYASNDSFTQRNGVVSEMLLRYTCARIMRPFTKKKHYNRFFHRWQRKNYRPLNRCGAAVFILNIRLHHLSNRWINRGTKVTHDSYTNRETII